MVSAPSTEVVGPERETGLRLFSRQPAHVLAGRLELAGRFVDIDRDDVEVDAGGRQQFAAGAATWTPESAWERDCATGRWQCPVGNWMVQQGGSVTVGCKPHSAR